ncbi:MAG: 30S ribosomal protein S9 [Patescibacteria group bacterium]
MATNQTKYWEAIGRRKTSTARVRISSSTKNSLTVNGREVKDYFKTDSEKKIVNAPLTSLETKWNVSVKVSGGGTHSQAEAVRHGLARALSLFDQALRPPLKSLGYLKRDPRAKERRKFGLKKARKAPKWSKR